MILETFCRRLERLGAVLGASCGVLARPGPPLGRPCGVLGRLGASWGRLGIVVGHLGSAPRAIQIKSLIFFIDFCFQLRPPKPSKSNPRCMENTLFKMRFLKLTSIFEISVRPSLIPELLTELSIVVKDHMGHCGPSKR